MKKNVTLVLSGGGARGFAHIGVIEEIEKLGYTINSIAGTSMGALVGGVYAVGKMNEFKEWAYSIDKRAIMKFIDFSFTNQGLVKGAKIFKAIKEFIPDANIEDLKIKYTATAFDLTHNREVVFDRGSLFDAIRASISIPTVFTPVILNDSVLVDGGVVNNIPIYNAVRTANDILIAVFVGADIPVTGPYIPKSKKNERHELYAKKMRDFKQLFFQNNARNQKLKLDYFQLINSTIACASNKLSSMIIQNHPPDILIEVSRASCGVYDFFKAEELVEIGRCAAKMKLESLKPV